MTDTILMMNQHRWVEASNKFFHNFDESLSFEERVFMLYEVDDVLKSLDLKYWLTNGSALGIVRENRFIPWDDDIDIDLYSEDLLPRFGRLVYDLSNAGYVCRFVERGATSKISAYKNNFKISLGGIYLEDNFRRSKFRLYPKEFFENSVEYKIKDRVFNIPGPVDEYLSFIYKDWKTPLKTNYVQTDFLNNKIPIKYNKKEN
jgi:phosphorylcholine metabolism protein LicD